MKRSAWIGVLMGLLVPMLGLVVQGAEGLPELHLRKIVLEPPSAVTRGEVVTVRAWVINTGKRPAGEFKAEFFYRLKSEGESWKSFQTVLISNLPPSQQDALEIKDDGRPIALDTSTLELGTYEIRVVADSNNQIPEGDEMNNELTTTLTLLPSRAGLPDLQPISVAFDPPSPASGELVVVSCEIRNTGTKDAGPFRVAFLVDNREFDGTSLETLSAGASVAAQGALDPYALGLGPGSHTVRVRVDSGTQVEEQDEANNELVTLLSIQGAELRPLGLEFDRPLVHFDERVTVSSRIKNAGRGGAEAAEVAFFVGGVPFALASLGPLGPGDEATAQGELVPSRLDLGLVPGAHEVRVVVDPHGLIPELDEANNELTKSLTIFAEEPKLAELHPESLELNLPSPVELGKADATTVSSVITNTGKTQAKEFGIEFGWRTKGTLRWEAVPCRDPVGCGGLILAPGAELKVEGTLPLVAALPGIYEVRVVVDPPEGCDLDSCSDVGTVAEVDETNNALATTLTLLSPRLPDLTFDPSSPLEVAPASPLRRGQTLRVLANLTNLGDTDAGPFEVEFSYVYVPEPSASGVAPLGITAEPSSCTRFAAVSLRGLVVGKKAQVQGLLETIDLRPGNYLIRATIDPALPDRAAGAVREKIETNNLLEVSVLAQGPDLAPVSLEITPSSPVVRGTVIDLKTTVVNLGVEPTGKFTVGVYWGKVASATGYAPDIEWYSIGAVSFPGIAVNNPELVTRTLDTSVLQPGEYLLRIVVDPEDRIEEQNEANNELSVPLVVMPRPADLRPEPLLSFEPEPAVVAGQPVKVHGAIMNDGDTPASEFRVAFLIRKVEEGSTEELRQPFASVLVPSLEPGARIDVTGVLDTLQLQGGNYEICIAADAENQVEESDELNNRFCELTVPLVVIPRPADLRPEPLLSFEPGPAVIAGHPVKVHGAIMNDGDTPAPEFRVAFLIRKVEEGATEELRQPFDCVLVPDLEPGARIDVAGVLDTLQLPAGTYEICIEADAENQVEEIDERNNRFCTPPPFVVIPPASAVDLVLRRFSVDSTWSRWNANVMVWITNQGADAAGPFLVQFSYEPTGRPGTTQGPVLFYTEEVSGLAAGETTILQRALSTASLSRGQYLVTVVVDPTNRVREQNEENNRASQVVTLNEDDN